MKTTLTTETTLADAVHGIAHLARKADPKVARVYIESSDQGRYMTATNVTYVGDEAADLDEYLNEQIDADAAIEIEDWASSISWSDAYGSDAKGWTVIDHKGGYYYIDVEQALKADPNQLTLIKPVDLVQGVLGLHIVTHTPLRERVCSCGATVVDMVAHRQHVAEKIVAVLS